MGRLDIPRRRIVLFASGLLAVGAVVAAAVGGSWEIAVVVLALLQVGVLTVVIDARARMARADAMSRIAPRMDRSDLKRENDARRLVASMESSRLEFADRQHALLEQLRIYGRQFHEDRESDAELRASIEAVAKMERTAIEGLGHTNGGFDPQSGRMLHTSIREVEAIVQLFARINPRAAMPSSGGWAIDPTALLAVLELIVSSPPSLVVELGSGTSSIWIGYALELQGRGNLITIEHDPKFAELTQASIEAHGLTEQVKLVVAPLEETDLTGHDAPWYRRAALEGLEDVDLLIVDGPPKSTGRQARFPALPVMREGLSRGAHVVIDDVNREDEGEIVERWLGMMPGAERLAPMPESSIAILRTAG